VENFAKEFFAMSGFEREVFFLSSSEYVTATRVVQKYRARREGLKTGDWRGVWSWREVAWKVCVNVSVFMRERLSMKRVMKVRH
jgi:hypothetical protein